MKITAYDYTIYGDLKGTLEQISADTIEEDTPHGKESYYQVLIKTDGSQLKRGEEVLPIIPGWSPRWTSSAASAACSTCCGR